MTTFTTSVRRALPAQFWLGLALIATFWPISWARIPPLNEFAFWPLWVGYILAVDGLVFSLSGTSLLARSRRAFLGLFLASAPLWWAFEWINEFTQNWHYLGAERYSPFWYFVVASWHFTVVVPAVLETAELVLASLRLDRFRRRSRLRITARLLIGSLLFGAASLLAMMLWPRYAFPLTWTSLFFILDPINYRMGRPSLFGWLESGDWRPMLALSAAGLICGWFWEMWNVFAWPKWYYTVPFVGAYKIFEMPILGYSGYLPFALEVYAGYHFLASLLPIGRVRVFPVTTANEG